MLAPGVMLEPRAEVGVGTGIGIRTTLEAGAFVAPCCLIEHGVRIGKNAAVGGHSYVGSGSKICDGVKLPAGAIIAPRTTVRDRSQAKALERFENRGERSLRDASGKGDARSVEMTAGKLLVLR